MSRTRLALIAPAAAILIGLFVIPIIYIGVQSLRPHLGFGQIGTGITLENYVNFFGDSYYRQILYRTIYVALMVTVLCLVLGFPLAQYIAQKDGTSRLVWQALVFFPLITSAVVRTFGWVLLLSETGFLNVTALRVGLINDPIDVLYSTTSIVIGMTQVLLPFMVLTLINALDNLEPSVLEASESLGARRVVTFWLITVPLSVPGIVAGSMLVFALTVSSFVTPALLGGLSSRVMATLTYDSAIKDVNWPFASVTSIVLLAVTLSLVTLYYRKAD